MSTTIERRPLTALLQATLETIQVNSANCKVGLAVMPLDSGWHGEPNAAGSSFVPYLVLHTGTAVPRANAGSLADPQGDWTFPYVVQTYGIDHNQCEWLADKARTALAPLRNEIVQLGASKYKVQQVWTSQIGNVQRVPDTDPPFYVQQDSVAMWLAKRRAP